MNDIEKRIDKIMTTINSVAIPICATLASIGAILILILGCLQILTHIKLSLGVL